MITMTARRLGAVALIALVAACSGGSDEQRSQTGRFLSVVETLQTSLRKAPELPNVTRALLNGLTVPSLEARVPRREALAYLIPLTSRRDARLGTLDTWATGDGTQLTYRSGVLVATRGLGDDVTSTDRAGSIAFVTGRGGDSWPLRLDIQTAANGVERHDFKCTGERNGRTTLEIVELSYPVESLSEICTSETGKRIENRYFVDARDGTIWESRQWAGDQIGYMVTRILKRP